MFEAPGDLNSTFIIFSFISFCVSTAQEEKKVGIINDKSKVAA
jgi:hypothetical protein